MDWNTFTQFCGSDLSNESIEGLARYLTEIGLIFWFNTRRLRSLVVFNPHFIARTLTEMTANGSQHWRHGLVTKDQLARCWNEHCPTHFIDTLIQLLDKFEVIFPSQSTPYPFPFPFFFILIQLTLNLEQKDCWIVPFVLPTEQTAQFSKALQSFEDYQGGEYRKFKRRFKFDFLPRVPSPPICQISILEI